MSKLDDTSWMQAALVEARAAQQAGEVPVGAVLVRDGEHQNDDGEDGGPPYLVRWEEDGHEGLLFPGSDAVIHHFEHHDSPAQPSDTSS